MTSDEIPEQFADALQNANRHIKELNLPSVDPSRVVATPSVRNAFTGLTDIKFTLKTVDFLSLENARQTPAFLDLMKRTQVTLQRLEVHFTSVRSQLLYRGEHTFNNLLSKPGVDSTNGPVPLEFLCLKELDVSSLIVHAPSLI